MDFDSFVAWVYGDFFAGAVDGPEQAADLLRQRADDLIRQRRHFDENRQFLEAEYYQRVAGYVADHLRVADTTGQLLDLAQNESPGRMLYFEPIGYELVRG